MEQILGVHQDSRRAGHSIRRGRDELGEDTAQADALSESESAHQHARDRYLRMFWEPVSESKGPVVPGVLERSSNVVAAHKEKEISDSSHPKLSATESPVPHGSTRVADRDGRPPIHFVDVGGKFLDTKDVQRRRKEGDRRSKVKAKRRERTAMLAKIPQSSA